MPDYATRGSPTFLSKDDEVHFIGELRKVVPQLRLVDGVYWDSPTPPVRGEIDDCRERTIFLWDADACAELPYLRREVGGFQGPASGVVAQFQQSIMKDGALLSGQIGIGYDKADAKIVNFVKLLWKVLKSMKAGTLESYDPKTGVVLEPRIAEYIVGAGAMELSRQGVVLKHLCAEAYYRRPRSKP